jgi:hypothetical protein
MATSGFCLRGQAARDHSTSGWKVNSATVFRFNDNKVSPSKAERFRRAKPAKPKSKIGKAGKSKLMTNGGAVSFEIGSIEFQIQGPNMTVKESQGRVGLISNPSAHSGGI